MEFNQSKPKEGPSGFRHNEIKKEAEGKELDEVTFGANKPSSYLPLQVWSGKGKGEI